MTTKKQRQKTTTTATTTADPRFDFAQGRLFRDDNNGNDNCKGNGSCNGNGKCNDTATATAGILWLLEVDDAVVFGLGDAEEGAVAEFGGEGDAVGGVGPGDEVGGEECAVALGVVVVVVVGEVAGG